MKKELFILFTEHFAETCRLMGSLAQGIEPEPDTANEKKIEADFAAQLHLEREAYTAEIRGTKLQVAEEKLRADQLLQRLRDKDMSLAKAELSIIRLKKLNKGNKKSR